MTLSRSTPPTARNFIEVFMAATVVGSVFATQANSEKKNRC
jgi:hypothetical protein